MEVRNQNNNRGEKSFQRERKKNHSKGLGTEMRKTWLLKKFIIGVEEKDEHGQL